MRCSRNTLAGLFVLALTGALPGMASAQFGGQSSGLGTTGGSQAGAGGSTTSGMFGSRTLGGNTTGKSGTGAASPTTTVGQGSTLTGSERFLQQNRQGAFVGADNTDAGNALASGNTARNSLQGLQSLQSMFSQQSRGGNQPQNGNNQKGKVQLRIPMKIAFTTKPIATTRATAAFQTRLTKLPAMQRAGRIAVTMEGETAVLRGMVATEADRSLATDLALMEPAISDVRNELVVDPAASTGEVLGPSTPVPQ